ncbi:MAG: serine/threonine-protein kinase [Gemmatimonadaceae bacterium]
MPADRPSSPKRVSEALAGVIDNRFEIESSIGLGGMAIVYRARDLDTGATVALKVMRPEVVHPEVCARFAREVKLTGGMTHPGILDVIASGDIRGRPYYVMPFIHGESLRTRLADGQALPVAEAVRIAVSVGEALSHAHARGVMHRDIKPANILLEGERVVLADFGIARAVDIATADRLTESGVALGTAHYMSPEQAAGNRVDSRTDIYSLACVLYEMLVGTPPFNGATTQQVLARHATSAVPGMREVRGTIPPELEEVVLRALEKMPADRFSTTDEFVIALRAAGDATVQRRSLSSTRRQRLLIWGGAGAIVLAGTFVAIKSGAPTLDPNKVLVLPLVTRSAEAGGASAGEDAATMIGAAIDGVGRLRSVDAWRFLDAEQRNDVRKLSPSATLQLARRTRSAYVLEGRIVPRGDSCDVFVDLRDADNDAVTARGRGSAPIGEPWRAALRAVNAVLPHLVGTGTVDVGSRWQDRSPKAVAAFLQGEAAYRRLRMQDALDRFREAVGHDSAFTVAALRGAQTASWTHSPREAGEFARLALRHPLIPRDAHFARGLAAYVEGDADVAAAAFDSATAIDPSMAIAWMQLGETFTHLLPGAGSVDSEAGEALARAYQLDSSAAPSVFHLAERAAREGNTAELAAKLAVMRAGNPDTMVLRNIELMQRCATAKGGRVDWSQDARVRPLPLLVASTKLAVGGRQLACAGDGFAATLAIDTAASGDAEARRFQALLGLVSVRNAQGQPDSAIAVIDRFASRWGFGSSLLVRQTFVTDKGAGRALAIVRQDSARYGADFRKVGFTNRLWLLGVWAARNGRLDAAAGVARELNRRADSTGLALDRRYAHSVLAHVSLARRDTAEALRLLNSLVGAPIPGDELQWQEASSLADERLMLARLLLAKGDAGRALGIASVFDSSQPAVFLMYLVPSLEIRQRAAEALGDSRLAARFETRIASMRASFGQSQ